MPEYERGYNHLAHEQQIARGPSGEILLSRGPFAERRPLPMGDLTEKEKGMSKLYTVRVNDILVYSGRKKSCAKVAETGARRVLKAMGIAVTVERITQVFIKE